jgi:hypothetical protein
MQSALGEEAEVLVWCTSRRERERRGKEGRGRRRGFSSLAVTRLKLKRPVGVVHSFRPHLELQEAHGQIVVARYFQALRLPCVCVCARASQNCVCVCLWRKVVGGLCTLLWSSSDMSCSTCTSLAMCASALMYLSCVCVMCVSVRKH